MSCWVCSSGTFHRLITSVRAHATRKGPAQAEDALAGVDLTQARVAGGQHDQFGAACFIAEPSPVDGISTLPTIVDVRRPGSTDGSERPFSPGEGRLWVLA
jgi:hypothetical protein